MIYYGAVGQILLGLSAVIGWKLHLTELLTWGTGGAPMQFNAALVMIGLGICTIRWSWIVAAGVVTLAAGAIVEAWLGTRILDEIFQQHFLTELTISPGRMAPNTSLLALGQLIAALAWSKQYHHTAWAASTFVGLNATASAMAYFSTMTGLYHWDASVTAMALPTAVALAVGTMPWVIWYGQRR